MRECQQQTGGPNWHVIILLATAILPSSLLGAPKLRLQSTTVGPISISQGSNGPVQTVEAFNAGDGSLNLQLTGSASWINPSVGAARGCSLGQAERCLPINIALQTSGLARGVYTGFVTVSDPNALDAPQTISVTVQIGGGVPDEVTLYVAPNGSAAHYRFATNSNLSIQTSTQSGGPWLSLTVDGNGSFRFVVPYRITGRHLEGMPEGDYRGTIAVGNSSVPAENKTVNVRMLVTSRPIAAPSPQQLAFRLAPSATPQTQLVRVLNSGFGTLSISSASASTSTGGSWLSASVSDGLIRVTANPSGMNTGTYGGTVIVSTNAANSELRIPVTLDVVAPGPPLAAFNGALNSGNFDTGLAPGSVAAVFGEQLSYEEAKQGTVIPLVRELGGARVLINDVPAPVFFTSYNQINFQIPYETPLGEAVLRVERGGQRGNGIALQISRRAPRIIQVGDNGVIVNPDGSLAIRGGTPARRGQVITIYCVGFGPTEPAVATGEGAPASEPLGRIDPEPRVILGNAFTGATVLDPLYVGLTPNLVGLYQVNVLLPEDLPAGEIQLLIEGDGYRSNSVLLPLQ
ncbi:MAG: hypothetical protein NZV14_07590 [Bryobacteraceae bacterium]|nr:hypothetical protein [Bryobacteraceae bacterium]MDW8378008.1 hypothetical protein [Bryobacterales bacterium]